MKFTLSLLLSVFAMAVFAQEHAYENLKKHVYILASDSLEGRGFGADGGHRASLYIANEYKEIGLKPIDEDYFHEFEHRQSIATIKGKNVVGILTGHHPTLKNEYIVMGGHYDHLGIEKNGDEPVIYNGADDNATGTSTVIEMARYFAKKANNQRTLVFIAFDGEESGLIGSRHFVNEEIIKLADIKLMFSIDMVGMYDTYQGLDMKGIEMLAEGKDVLDKIALKQNIAIKKMGAGVSNRTDTKHFGDAGIPAVHVTTGTKSPYHQPEDDAPLLEYEGMVKVERLLCGLVEELDNKEVIAPAAAFAEAAAQPKENKTKSYDKPVRFAASLHTGRNYHRVENAFFDSKKKLAMDAGVMAQIKLGKLLFIQPEILYQFNGAETINGDYQTHGITTPVHIALHAPTGGPEYPFVMAGGYYTHIFEGKIGNSSQQWSTNFENSEYGFSWGIGMQTRFAQIGFYQRFGLSDIDKSNATMNNRASYFSIAYMF